MKINKLEIKPTKAELQVNNALGDDRNLHEHGHDRKYWYSIADGFRLLLALRQNHLLYTSEDGPSYRIKAAGEEYTATRENRERLLVTEPYFIDNFAASLTDDIRTITATHTIDEHGIDQHAKNNLWALMPTTVIIPLLSGGHWQVIRIQINYNERAADILYDNPYGARSFGDNLVERIRPSLITEITKLINHQVRIISATEEIAIKDITIRDLKKTIDQQGSLINSYDCGPIAFSNIADYIRQHQVPNEQFISNIALYTVPIAAATAHAALIQKIREADVSTYARVVGVK